MERVKVGEGDPKDADRLGRSHLNMFRIP
jgi:hypothetical protein